MAWSRFVSISVVNSDRKTGSLLTCSVIVGCGYSHTLWTTTQGRFYRLSRTYMSPTVCRIISKQSPFPYSSPSCYLNIPGWARDLRDFRKRAHRATHFRSSSLQLRAPCLSASCLRSSQFPLLCISRTTSRLSTMRQKRAKAYKRLMNLYCQTFGFRQPFQVLGT